MKRLILLRNKSKYFPLVFSSLMLALSLISAMFSNLIPFFLGSSFLRVDFGMTFIFLSFIISGWKYGLITILGNFLIHPFLPGTNIGLIEAFFIGKTIFVITTLIYISIYFIVLKMVKHKNHLICFIVTIIITSISMIALNGLIFTPIFFYVISNGSYSLNFIEFMGQYEKNSSLQVFFILPNYWAGISLVYGLFNVIILSINSWISYSLIKCWKILF